VKVYLKDKVALEEVKLYLQLVLEQDHIHFYKKYITFFIKKLMIIGLNIFQMI